MPTLTSSLPYVVFKIADQCFGLSAACVREMFVLPSVTPIPNAPAYVRGLINLRGKIVNLMDLRRYIDLPAFNKEHEPARLKEMVVVYEVDGHMQAFTVDEVIAVESVHDTCQEGIQMSDMQRFAKLDGTLARREKTGDVLVLLEPDMLRFSTQPQES